MRALLVMFLVGSSGCAHTMIIETEPAGASVMIDGKSVGDSPVISTQFTSTGGRLHVTVDAESYQTANVVVTQTEVFWWPVLIAMTPLIGLPFVVIPVFGPLITLAWAVISSPTLFALLFLQKYPDRVKIQLKPRLPGGIVQPTDGWAIPSDMDPNPPPLPRDEPALPPRPMQQPAQPEGGNPVP